MYILIEHPRQSRIVRLICLFVILASLITGIFFLYTVSLYKEVINLPIVYGEKVIREVDPFPVSVYPKEKLIKESSDISIFLRDSLVLKLETDNKPSWREKVFRRLAQSGLFQQLATPNSRALVLWSGERQEEISDNIATILGWSKADKEKFISLSRDLSSSSEGTLLPGNYVVAANASPEEVFRAISERFDDEVQARYPASLESTIPLNDTLTVASLIEREAYSFEHMRIISGVIWKRIFIGMPLQLDATLQYAKAPTAEGEWWPAPTSKDKFIDSPFNTYQNIGLPPAPISNPSIAAVLAALNPIESDCLFYFHDDDGTIHCSTDYQEHVSKLKSVFGQGR